MQFNSVHITRVLVALKLNEAALNRHALPCRTGSCTLHVFTHKGNTASKRVWADESKVTHNASMVTLNQANANSRGKKRLVSDEGGSAIVCCHTHILEDEGRQKSSDIIGVVFKWRAECGAECSIGCSADS